MPVPPDEMIYGNVTNYDAQMIEWLKQERANLFDRLAKVEAANVALRAALYRIIELDHHNQGVESRATTIAREALNQHYSLDPKIGWMGDISGNPFGPSDR